MHKDNSCTVILYIWILIQDWKHWLDKNLLFLLKKISLLESLKTLHWDHSTQWLLWNGVSFNHHLPVVLMWQSSYYFTDFIPQWLFELPHVYACCVWFLSAEIYFMGHTEGKCVLLTGGCPGQFSSVTQSCLTLCNPMDCSMSGLPVHHQLPELAHTHAYRVGDAIQSPHPLSSPSPPTFNLSRHRGLFK